MRNYLKVITSQLWFNEGFINLIKKLPSVSKHISIVICYWVLLFSSILKLESHDNTKLDKDEKSRFPLGYNKYSLYFESRIERRVDRNVSPTDKPIPW